MDTKKHTSINNAELQVKDLKQVRALLSLLSANNEGGHFTVENQDIAYTHLAAIEIIDRAIERMSNNT